MIVGQQVTPAIKQTASFLNAKGVRVTCVEFTFFKAEGGDRLMSIEIVISEEPPKPGPRLSVCMSALVAFVFPAATDLGPAQAGDRSFLPHAAASTV